MGNFTSNCYVLSFYYQGIYMNHVYRVVFNHSLGVYQCVSELAKSRGKSSGKSQVATKLLLTPLAFSILGFSGTAMAVTYDNGMTNKIPDDTYVVIDDLIIGDNTQVDFFDVIIGQNKKGQLRVTNDALADGSLSVAPEVTSNKVILGAGKDSDGTLTLNLSTKNSTAVKMNVKDDLIVGESGTGHLYVQDASRLSIQGDLISGQLSNSLNNTIDINSSYYSETNADVKGKTIIGDAGSSKLTINNGYITSNNSFVIGNKPGSNGEVLVDAKAARAFASSKTRMDVGYAGDGNLTVLNGSAGAKLVVVGTLSTGKGIINLTGKGENQNGSVSLGADKLIIGDAGIGVVNVSGLYDGDSWGYGSNLEVGILGNEKGAQGTLNVDNSAFEVEDNLIVGNEGSGTLNAVNSAILEVGNITRSTNSESSKVTFDNALISISNTQDRLFDGFDDSMPIHLKSGGLILETYDVDVTVNPDAILTGNVGTFDWDKLKGGFVKAGTGTLTMSSNSKQWIGETLITEGVLELNGNYTMAANETLGIALDIEEEGNLESYGQLVVNGDADISKGTLKVYASEAIKNMTGSNEWKDIVKATTRQGEFTAVNDNSPLVSFYADYSDANAVHLKMGTPPVVTPEPPVVTPEPPVGDTTFVESVNTQSQRNDAGIAYVLDKAIQDRMTNGDNALADSLISSTINFKQAQLATAANQLQPLFMGATNRIITDANYAATDAINDHSQTTPQRNLWAQLLGDDSSHDAENGITGYDSEGYGAIVGLDTPINSDLNLGVAFSYIKSDADTDGTNLDQELTSKNWQVLGYGNYAVSDTTALNFHAGAGRSDVEGERHIALLTDAIAQSDYSVDTLQAGLGVDHRIGTQQRNVTPFAQVNYARAESDNYRETGAGVYNLNVDDNTYESMRWTAGLRLSQALTPTLALTGQLAAAIENGDRRSDITASFINMPNDEFTTIGQEIGSEIGIAGIGLSYTPTINTKLSVGYRGEWRDNYDSQGANVSLQTTF